MAGSARAPEGGMAVAAPCAPRSGPGQERAPGEGGSAVGRRPPSPPTRTHRVVILPNVDVHGGRGLGAARRVVHEHDLDAVLQRHVPILRRPRAVSGESWKQVARAGERAS